MTNVIKNKATPIPVPCIGMKKKPKKQTTLREDMGKYLLDISKLVFGSIFLGSILRGEMPRVILGASGFAGALVLLIIGLLFVKKEKPPFSRNDEE